MPESSRFTPTSLVEAASEVLESAGYVRARLDLEVAGAATARVFEDVYGVVGVVAFDTWDGLETSWPDAQGALTELMSSALARTDAKAWEGYLVLMTAAPLDAGQRGSATSIRGDTTRLRKFVVTGDDVQQLDDVRRSLLPLLPLEPLESVNLGESVLALLPDLLSAAGIQRQAAEGLVAAFSEQRSLMEALHAQVVEE